MPIPSSVTNPICWQGELEERTVRKGDIPQTTSMRLDNRAAYRQSHSNTERLGGEERFKDTGCLIRVDPGSRILNLDQSTVGIVCRCDTKFSWPVSYFVHGIDTVHRQVYQDLL